MLWPLRNSNLENVSYVRARDLWMGAAAVESEFPHIWEACRVAIGRFNLDDGRKPQARVGVVDAFAKYGWGAPEKLATVHATQLEATLANTSIREAANQLWTARVILFADLSSAYFLLLKGGSRDAAKLIIQLRPAPARFKAVHPDTKYALMRLEFKQEFDMLGPSAKLQRLRAAHLPQFRLNRYFRTASQDLALRGIMK